ncbi:Mpo1 family 2-hydroxy fatty acid dioxygenase [Vibrio sp. Vf1514]|uniref:Mpo1 family 2-hydroxy fatty acid dioxygenase n=1 Tax=Vibrio sp. Vf1514 TaxID=3437381 RepID=UPI003F892853
MRTLEQWLDAYAVSHQHPTNQAIHHIAVPGIYLSIVGLIWSLPSLSLLGMDIHWIWLVSVPVLWFYARLSMVVCLMMLGFTLVCIGLAWSVEAMALPLAALSFALFVLLWGAQFVGHRIEGKKPSFFADLQFLLIGPLWVFYKH